MNVKICIFTTVHSTFDGRIFYKEAKSLVNFGYKVTLIAQYSKNEIIDGVKIIALPKPKNRFIRIFVLTWRAFCLALRQHADVYHFHDPELIILGIILKILGKKVVYDVHEDVPKQIMNKNWLGNNQIRKFVAFIMNIVEQIGALLFNKIVVATPDIARKFPKNNTVILRNFPILEFIDNTMPANYKKDKPIIIYAGGLTKIRGIEEIIQAMEYIGDRAELWLLGKWENEKYKKECENLDGWKYTRYLGFKKLEEVYSYMKVSDVGMSILYPTKNHLTRLLIKSFEYMACSLPIVMSNFDYWRGIFGECALFADPYNPKDIANKVLHLLGDIDKAKTLGEKGRQLIKERYDWELESEKLLNIYNTI